MKPEVIMLSEIRQTRKTNTTYFCLFVKASKSSLIEEWNGILLTETVKGREQRERCLMRAIKT
jgi:hypothetical protein